MIVFFIIFGIVAINLFKGRFYDCVDEFVEKHPADDLVYKWDCINGGGEWVKSYYNFDNMYEAIASLFIISNVYGWIDFMYTGASVADIDMVR